MADAKKSATAYTDEVTRNKRHPWKKWIVRGVMSLIMLCIAFRFIIPWVIENYPGRTNPTVPSGYVYASPPVPPAKPQSVRIWAPPCATAGDRSTWSSAVKPAGLCDKVGDDYVGVPVDASLFNYNGQKPKVLMSWTPEDENILIYGVLNNDFDHPLIPFPASIGSAKSVRWGTGSKKGTWITVTWVPVPAR